MCWASFERSLSISSSDLGIWFGCHLSMPSLILRLLRMMPLAKSSTDRMPGKFVAVLGVGRLQPLLALALHLLFVNLLFLQLARRLQPAPLRVNFAHDITRLANSVDAQHWSSEEQAFLSSR